MTDADRDVNNVMLGENEFPKEIFCISSAADSSVNFHF